MSVSNLSARVHELETAFGIEANGAYSDRVLALLALIDSPSEQLLDEAATGTIEGQLSRLKSLFGEDIALDDEPMAATIEEAVAAIESTLNAKPKKE